MLDPKARFPSPEVGAPAATTRRAALAGAIPFVEHAPGAQARGEKRLVIHTIDSLAMVLKHDPFWH